jgi:uncharacterized integral membrane protein
VTAAPTRPSQGWVVTRLVVRRLLTIAVSAPFVVANIGRLWGMAVELPAGGMDGEAGVWMLAVVVGGGLLVWLASAFRELRTDVDRIRHPDRHAAAVRLVANPCSKIGDWTGGGVVTSGVIKYH